MGPRARSSAPARTRRWRAARVILYLGALRDRGVGAPRWHAPPLMGAECKRGVSDSRAVHIIPHQSARALGKRTRAVPRFRSLQYLPIGAGR